VSVPVFPALFWGPLDVRAALLSLLVGGATACLFAAVVAGLPRPRARRGASRLERWLRTELRHARLYDVRPRDLVGLCALCGLLVWVLAARLSGWLLPALVVGVLGAGVPLLLVRLRAERLHAATQTAILDAIRLVRDAVRTQRSIRGSLDLMVTEGPLALRPEFERVLVRQRSLGLEAALAELRVRLADPIGDFFMDALIVNLQTGGTNLSATLDNLAQLADGEHETRCAIRADQTRTRLTALGFALLPGMLLLYLRVTSPRAVEAFNLPLGQVLLLVGAALCVGGYLAMLKVGQLPARPRLFDEEELQ
jgi:tight adherence protein B